MRERGKEGREEGREKPRDERRGVKEESWERGKR